MSTTSNGRGLWAWTLVQVVISAALLFYVFLFAFGGFNEESNRIAIRISAKVSFFLFCAAFGASSIHLFARQSWSYWLRMNRRYLGITFAISHWVHLVFLIVLQSNFHPVFIKAAPFALFAGGMAYLFLSLMFLTSFPTFSRFLSKKQWTWLHTIGAYWIWTIFMSGYSKRSMIEWEYVPYVVILLTILALRIWKFIKNNT